MMTRLLTEIRLFVWGYLVREEEKEEEDSRSQPGRGDEEETGEGVTRFQPRREEREEKGNARS